MADHQNRDKIRRKIHEIIFEADTDSGKVFDEVLLILIGLSVIAAAIETIPNIHHDLQHNLIIFEWIFTLIFTIEYILRIYSTLRPYKYITSFYGVVDLLAIVPTYLSLFFAGSQALIIIRALRLLRIFRIFKMGKYVDSSQIIIRSMKLSLPKITVFLYFILLVVCIFGAIMYLVEGSTNPSYDSIPRSIYWAIVTITTVGFGDITPNTFVGQFLSAILMILGYAVIAVPTGIVSSEIITSRRKSISTQTCMYCSAEGHDDDAKYCKYCGEQINPVTEEDEG